MSLANRRVRGYVLLAVLLSACGWAISMGLMLTEPPRPSHAASAEFMPEGGGGTSVPGFGVQLGAGGSSPSAELYADLVRSRHLLRDVVDQEFTASEPVTGIQRGTLGDFVMAVEGRDAVPVRTAAGRLLSNLSVTVRGTGVIELQVASYDPLLAEQLVRAVLDRVGEFDQERRQRKAVDEAAFISARMNDVRSELEEAERTLATFLQTNPQFENSPELLFEYDRLNREVAMRQSVYTSLAQSRETALMDAARDTPVLTMVSRPEGSARPVRARDLAVRSGIGIGAGLVLSALLIILLEGGRQARERGGADYREFVRLRRATWREVRNPLRIFGVGHR